MATTSVVFGFVLIGNCLKIIANHTCCGQNVNILSVFCWLEKKQKQNTIEDIRCNLSQESKIAACTWFKEFFHHSWLLWNSENHELHKCYFIKFDLSVKTWQPAFSQVWEISTSCSKCWLVCALMFNFAHISWSHIWLVMTQ